MDSSKPEAFSLLKYRRMSARVAEEARRGDGAPEESLPGGEIGSLEEGVLENTLYSSKRGDNIDAVVVDCRRRG